MLAIAIYGLIERRQLANENLFLRRDLTKYEKDLVQANKALDAARLKLQSTGNGDALRDHAAKAFPSATRLIDRAVYFPPNSAANALGFSSSPVACFVSSFQLRLRPGAKTRSRIN